MKFSVVTVCLNAKAALEKSLRSLLAQTDIDYEWVVVDGGSTDGTLELLGEREGEFGGRLTWISEPDAGIYDAMNKGIARSKGSFIYMLNAGDVFADDDVLARVAAAIAENPSAMIYYGAVRQGGKRLEFAHERLHRRTICHQACFIARAAHERFGGYDLKHPIAADYAFLLKASLGKAEFVRMNELIAIYDMTGVSERNLRRQILDFHSVQLEAGLIGRIGFGFLVIARLCYKSIRRFCVGGLK